ncbi:MAG: dihydroorotate dehydrogenase [Candidatus Thermoplasmatota archaeon]|jgi:dihydroorotate dehydrogenase (NAD+) catalytic subunit|nr:dihydroorotate dehydrogenase [Candidatus Thermoplasmatota archaeon]
MADDATVPDLSVEFAGIKLSNPLLLASGIADETGASMARAVKEGAGGVVTKSLSIQPRQGHPNPCIVEVEGGLINAMGLPNPGIEGFREEIEHYKKKTRGRAPIIASVFGSSIEEYVEASTLAEGLGVDGLELNGSCPNAKGLGLQFGQDPVVIIELVREVKARTTLPVLFKLTPNTHDIVTLARAVQEGGADGIVAINTLQAMKIDIMTARPVLTNTTGGLSGPAIRPVGVRCVFEMARAPDIRIPIMGVGGISTWEDVIEYMMAGATAVQVGTSISWGNLNVFGEMKKGLRAFLMGTGRRSIKDITGLAAGVGH